MDKPLRQHILETGIGLTCGDRQSAYGDPTINLKMQGEMMALFRKYCPEGKYSPGHDACLVAVIQKICRAACGNYRQDNYVDGAVYFAMAGECEETARGQ